MLSDTNIAGNFNEGGNLMTADKTIKAILFDSGNVLNYPRTGNWFIPPNFYRYIDETYH